MATTTNTGGLKKLVDSGEVPPLEPGRKKAIQDGYKEVEERRKKEKRRLIVIGIIVILALITITLSQLGLF